MKKISIDLNDEEFKMLIDLIDRYWHTNGSSSSFSESKLIQKIKNHLLIETK